MTMNTSSVSEMSPVEAQAFAAGYLEALHDHTADSELLAAQETEIRTLQRRLAAAQEDLEVLKRTVAALEDESTGYFEQLQEMGAFDAELIERAAAYRARQAANLRRVAERLREQRPDYMGGPIRWPEPP
ncbi:MAG: hypothetical protein ACTHJI_03210 [Leifsonia sp.]